MNTVIETDNINKEIEKITRRIKQGNCILFLGPNVLKTSQGIPLNNAFALHLGEILKAENIPFLEKGNEIMSYMIQQYIKGMNEKFGSDNIKMIDIREMYLDFFQKAAIDYSLYEKLSKIPFSLVINTNYDKKFSELFTRKQTNQEQQTHFSFYDFSDPVSGQKIVRPDKKNLLVYNIFGLCDNKDSINSLILTEIEFIRFVGRIHQADTNIPGEITNHIAGDKHCIFVGFDFNQWQWHLKIVIKALIKGSSTDPQKETSPPPSSAFNVPDDLTTTFFYNSELKFSFINHGLNSFIKEIDLLFPDPNSTSEAHDIFQANIIKPIRPVNIVFVSDFNNKQDNIYRQQIFDQLIGLSKEGYINIWTEDLALGDKNMKNILIEKIRDADILIPLASPDFFVQEKLTLLNNGLLLNKNKNLIKLAVLSRPVITQSINQFFEFTWQPLEEGKHKALSIYSDNIREQVISSIAEWITNKVNELRK